MRLRDLTGAAPVAPAELAGLVARVRSANLTYLDEAALTELAEAAVATEEQGLDGSVVEAGTALGGSAIVLGAAKRRRRPLLLHDVFGQIPPPGPEDGEDVHHRYQDIAQGRSTGIGGDGYYGYRADLADEVARNLRRFGLHPRRHRISLVPGLFQDTLVDLEGPVALAHLDGDWYESTMVCLRSIGALVVVGGRMVIDDYGAWSGCRRATDEFLASPLGRRFRTEQRARLHLVRVD